MLEKENIGNGMTTSNTDSFLLAKVFGGEMPCGDFIMATLLPHTSREPDLWG